MNFDDLSSWIAVATGVIVTVGFVAAQIAVWRRRSRDNRAR